MCAAISWRSQFAPTDSYCCGASAFEPILLRGSRAPLDNIHLGHFVRLVGVCVCVCLCPYVFKCGHRKHWLPLRESVYSRTQAARTSRGSIGMGFDARVRNGLARERRYHHIITLKTAASTTCSGVCVCRLSSGCLMDSQQGVVLVSCVWMFPVRWKGGGVSAVN